MPPNQRAELTYLQSLSETELRELVIIPLLTRMGYRGVRSVHGSLELGKDIVFSQPDPLAHERNYSVVVKKGPLTGSVSSSNSLRAAAMQVEQSLDTPFLDPRNGREVMIDGVYVITSFPISQAAIMSCSGALGRYGGRVSMIDGAALADLIRQYQPDATWAMPKDLGTGQGSAESASPAEVRFCSHALWRTLRFILRCRFQAWTGVRRLYRAARRRHVLAAANHQRHTRGDCQGGRDSL